MIIYNKSRREARNRLVARSWERPFLKFKVSSWWLMRRVAAVRLMAGGREAN